MDREPDWVSKHKSAWHSKPGLRDFYVFEVYNRIIESLLPGPSLDIGTGAGFFAARHEEMCPQFPLFKLDITRQSGVDLVADVHALPFKRESFSNLICIHVLHHFAQPRQALSEMARILIPGGRIFFIEPWTGPLGKLFYTYVHHEGYAEVDDPWMTKSSTEKDPMEANTALGKLLFVDCLEDLEKCNLQIHLLCCEVFASLSYLLTGGFSRLGAPYCIVRISKILDQNLPRRIMKFVGLQVMYILEKNATVR